MSFYGSIYYQLVDAFNRLWFSNQGKDSVLFPEEDKLVNPNPAEGVPEDTFEYHSPGRQGVIDLKSGNRWIVFTQNDEDKSFKIWHRGANTEKNTPGNGFQYIPNMYLVIQQPEETIDEAIARCLRETTDKIAEEGGTFTLEEGCRVVIEIPSEEEGIDPSHVIYKYNINGEWEKEQAEAKGMVTILRPDDFFVTTESYAVDEAGHMIPGSRHLYKMPKSDVQEEIDALKARMTKNEEHDDNQDKDIELLDEYVGDWSVNRGYIFERLDDEGNPTYGHWVPTISSSIGPMTKLIDGSENSDTNRAYYDNKEVTIVGAIGNLEELLNDLKQDTDFGLTSDSKVSSINLIQVIRYLKNTLIASNTESIKGHTGQLTNLTIDINKLYEADDVQDGQISDLNAEVEAINNPETGILATAKKYTDDLKNGQVKDNHNDIVTLRDGTVKSNTEAITAINDPNTGILANAKSYTDNLANGQVKDNKAAIEAINNETTGILAKSKEYTNELANGAVKNNTDAIADINDENTGILKQAEDYTDSKIDSLDYADNDAAIGKYVYSVTEADGVIAVEHKDLPTYTLTSGDTIGTVALNGQEATVKGLGSAAYANTDNFDLKGTASNLIEALDVEDSPIDGQYVSSVSQADGKITVNHVDLPVYTLAEGSKNGAVSFNGTDVSVHGLGSAAYKEESAFDAAGTAERLINALKSEGGAIKNNTDSIEALQLLLQDYNNLVDKVRDLEFRVNALESPTPGEEQTT